MSNKVIETSGSIDNLLDEVNDVLSDTLDKIEASEDHAILLLGVKYVEPDNDEGGVQTYIAASGFYEILAEGLYAELKDQIEKGHTGLFMTLRQVIRDLEEDLGIDPDEELEEDDSPSNLH